MFELEPGAQSVLKLQLWPDGGTTLLAAADPHCRSIEWLL
jgi:hypothetical protein